MKMQNSIMDNLNFTDFSTEPRADHPISVSSFIGDTTRKIYDVTKNNLVVPIYEKIKSFFEPLFSNMFTQMKTMFENLKICTEISLRVLKVFQSVIDFLVSLSNPFISYLMGGGSSTIRTISLLSNAWDLWKIVAEACDISLITATGQSGPMEQFLSGALLTTMLPASIKNMFKDMSMFTSFKLLDDSSWIYDILGYFISIPRRLLIATTSENSYKVEKDTLLNLESYMPFSQLGGLHYRMSRSVKAEIKKPNVVMDSIFQEDVLEVEKEMNNILQSYSDAKHLLPTYMVVSKKNFMNLVKRIKEQRNQYRVEPVCCIFTGPAGVGKSVFMKTLVQGYSGCSRIFAHAPLAEKNFMDSYEGEEVVTIDDIGAKGPYQWQDIVNWVSVNKCPLECAVAEKKNTKFFTSRLILATCNKIPDSFHKDDKVSDLTAFNRRLVKFDFAKVKFDEGVYTGDIVVSKYDKDFRIWRSIATFPSSDGDFNYEEIENFIYLEMKAKIAHFKASENRLKETRFRAIPEAGPGVEGFYDCLFGLKNLGERLLDRLSQGLQGLTDYLRSLSSGSCKLLTLIGISSLAIMAGVYTWLNTKKDEEIPEMFQEHKHHAAKEKKWKVSNVMPQTIEDIQMFRNDVSVPQLSKYKSNLCNVEISYTDLSGKAHHTYMVMLISGDVMLAPYHPFYLERGGRVLVTVHADVNNIIYDHAESILVDFNKVEDWAILKLKRTQPRLLSKIKVKTEFESPDLYLAVPGGLYDLKDRLRQSNIEVDYYNILTEFKSYIKNSTHKFYDLNKNGLCGSLLLSKDGGLVGHHVAGIEIINSDGTIENLGAARIFSISSLKLIQGYFDGSLDSNFEIVRKDRADPFSCAETTIRGNSYPSTETSYVESLVAGIFPRTRVPSDKTKYGEETIEIVTQTEKIPQVDIDPSGLDFAEGVLGEVLDGPIEGYDLEDFTEKEIVLGNKVMNRIDPNTGTGYGIPGKKRDLMDYEKGTLSKELKDMIREVVEDVRTDKVPKTTWYETCLKDELKEVGKDPRTFCAGPITLTVLFRWFIGPLSSKIMKNRMRNGIMIGVNPHSTEWDSMARKLKRNSKYCSDLDYKKFDKTMPSEFQRMVIRQFIRQSTNNFKLFNKIFETDMDLGEYVHFREWVFDTIVNTIVVSKSKVFVTNHNNPSGCAVTALLNSCVNISYIAYAYYMALENSSERSNLLKIEVFVQNIVGFYYGDDVTLSFGDEIRDHFNPIVIRDELAKIGLTVTRADKESWNDRNLFEPVEKLTFLKRSFKYHTAVGRIVGPLDIKSMTSTLNYISDGSRDVELTIEKLLNFQREAFLHEDLYEPFMVKILDRSAEVGLHPKFLSRLALRNMLLDDVSEYSKYLPMA